MANSKIAFCVLNFLSFCPLSNDIIWYGYGCSLFILLYILVALTFFLIICSNVAGKNCAAWKVVFTYPYFGEALYLIVLLKVCAFMLCLWVRYYASKHLNSGDVHSNPGPDSTGVQKHSLKFVSTNINGLNNRERRSELKASLSEYSDISVVCLQETKVGENFLSSELELGGYQIYRKDRKLGGGGILTAVSNELQSSRRLDLEVDFCEMMWIEIEIDGRKLLVGNFYRPHKKQTVPIKVLQWALAKASSGKNTKTFLFGDFNAPDACWKDVDTNVKRQISEGSRLLMSTLDDNCLTQLVKRPTRGKNILDLVCVSHPSLVDSIEIGAGISDHQLLVVKSSLAVRLGESSRKVVTMWKLANIEKLKGSIKQFSEDFCREFETRSLQANWELFKNTLIAEEQKNVPSKVITTFPKHKFKIPRKLVQLIRKKRRIFRKASAANDPAYWVEFSNIRKEVKRELSKNHKLHLEQIGSSLESKPKMFWGYLKKLRNDQVSIPDLKTGNIVHKSAVDKASTFNDFFRSVFTQESSPDILPTFHHCNTYMQNVDIGEEGVLRLLKKLDVSKSAGYDGLSAKLLSVTADEICPMVTKIFEASLRTGELPEDWKMANIHPIFKKGSRSAPGNYRPVSLTSILCKQLEHIVSSQIHRYLDEFKLLSENQCGFRKGHSCEGQLISLLHSWSNPIDKGFEVDAILLDFSKAFDTVPHGRLIYKLEGFGIDPQTLRWITAFLNHRRQRVRIDGHFSEWAPVTSGVPQGSVLGPLLFLLYINDISDGVNSQIGLFADDCIVHRTILGQGDENALQNDLDSLQRWSDRWLLKFNVSKCNHLRFSASKKSVKPNYKIAGGVIPKVSAATYLGVTLQENFKFSKHIENIVKKCNSILFLLRRNLKYAPKKAKTVAYTALVRSRIEYASAAWCPHYKKDIDRCEAINNRGARFIQRNYSRYASVTEMKLKHNLTTLALRREHRTRQIFEKYVNQLVAIPNGPNITLASNIPRSFGPKLTLQVTKHLFFQRVLQDIIADRARPCDPILPNEIDPG